MPERAGVREYGGMGVSEEAPSLPLPHSRTPAPSHSLVSLPRRVFTRTLPSVELIDLRTVAPLDVAPVLESVAKTGRLLVAHEAVVPFGIGAEVAAAVAREAFWALDAPIERVGAAPTPPPYAPPLERAWLPDRTDITAALRRLAAV